jgi:hypothetical protein
VATHRRRIYENDENVENSENGENDEDDENDESNCAARTSASYLRIGHRLGAMERGSCPGIDGLSHR